MKKTIVLFAIILAGIGSVHAGQKKIDYLNAKDPKLNAKEWKAVKLAHDWMNKKEYPYKGQNGMVKYLFGASLPSIVCAPLTMTDIQLEPGEIVHKDGVHLADIVHFSVLPAASGPPGNEVPHIIVKAKQVGMKTMLMVGTNRRTYHFKLICRKQNFMPIVGFDYPEDNERKWREYHTQQAAHRKANTIPATGENIEDLYFEYKVDGEAPWKPVRVYNNGLKTIIQFPEKIKSLEAPALLLLGSDNKEQVVTYRPVGPEGSPYFNRYRVDAVFEKAILIAGVGKYQTRITITKR